MAGVDRVPPEGILSLPNAAAPQLLATPLNQRRRDKAKRKRARDGKTIACVCVYVHMKKKGDEKRVYLMKDNIGSSPK